RRWGQLSNASGSSGRMWRASSTLRAISNSPRWYAISLMAFRPSFFLHKNNLVAAHPRAAALQFGQREPALAVKVENLFGRCDLVRITADPIHDVSPTGHAANVVRLDPRAQVFAGTAVQRGA